MKRNPFKLVAFLILLLTVSCDEPVTVVTNIIHINGTITRMIEMRSSKKKFEISDIQVPVDSTWSMSDSCEVSEKGDTTWIRRGRKLFTNVDEINLAYKNDSGCNRSISRHAGFSKKFRWFNTIYLFSETIGKKMKYGYPVSDFMNKEELLWFYSPAFDTEANLNGPDSLRFRTLKDSVDMIKDQWIGRCIVSEWLGEFSELVGQVNIKDLNIDSLKKNEEYITNTLKQSEKDFDSLWQSGYILKEFIGETNALKYRSEADSSMKIIENRILEDFSDYSVKMSMPGTLIASNGFTDSSQILIWPVSSDYFFADDYLMWAESRVPNIWAWVVSGVFIIFVITGVIIRKKRKADFSASLN